MLDIEEIRARSWHRGVEFSDFARDDISSLLSELERFRNAWRVVVSEMNGAPATDEQMEDALRECEQGVTP